MGENMTAENLFCFFSIYLLRYFFSFRERKAIIKKYLIKRPHHKMLNACVEVAPAKLHEIVSSVILLVDAIKSEVY